MRMRIAAFLLLTVAWVAPAMAESTNAQMNVSVQVVARTLLTVDAQPSSVEVAPADIARGYIDVPRAIAFRIRSNASSGYSLQFEPVSYPFSGAAVKWENSTATFGNDGAWLTRPYQRGTTIGTMNVRLALAPTAQPGRYAWPVTFEANSL